MTIEEVMSRILAWQKSKPGDIYHNWNYVRDALQSLVVQAQDTEVVRDAERWRGYCRRLQHEAETQLHNEATDEG